MGGDTETIKDRLDIAEIVGAYVKLDKTGINWKGRCPFHTEKTPSFFVSPLRKSYYCFGCGAKGDIFTFVEEMEGMSFVEALKSLAERAGVELKGTIESARDRGEKAEMRRALETARESFETHLSKDKEALAYLKSRGLDENSIRVWRLGYAPDEWHSLLEHLTTLGFNKGILIKAGLVKVSGTKHYDVFRKRIIFPLSDASGEIDGFAGRAASTRGVEAEPKYLNSPDTVLFHKSSLLYGLDKAKTDIRKKNYAVLVEGQIDLILSHQSGILNTVASSGTAFTAEHLKRLKGLSERIILAFDADPAGIAASEKATTLALSLGLEVKVAKLPEGRDPADVIKEDPNEWKQILRESVNALEYFLDRILEKEKDVRKSGKLIKEKILPMISLLESSIERAHFISLIAKKTGIKEDVIWEDLRKTHSPPVKGEMQKAEGVFEKQEKSHKDLIVERLDEVKVWLKDMPQNSEEAEVLEKEKSELEKHLKKEELMEELENLKVTLTGASTSNEVGTLKRIGEVHKELRVLEG